MYVTDTSSFSSLNYTFVGVFLDKYIHAKLFCKTMIIDQLPHLTHVLHLFHPLVQQAFIDLSGP